MTALRRRQRPIFVFEHENEPLHRADLFAHICRSASDRQCIQRVLGRIEHVAFVYFAQQPFIERGRESVPDLPVPIR